MAYSGNIRWDEGPVSVSTNASTATLNYVIVSDDPENDDRIGAINWLNTNVAYDYFGLVIDSIAINERIAETSDEAMWDATVKYVLPEKKKPKELKFDKDKPSTDPQGTRLTVRSGSGGSLTMTSSREFLAEIYGTNTGGSNVWSWESEDKINRLLNLDSGKEDDWSMFSAKGISVPVGTVEIVAETVRGHDNITAGGYLVQAALMAGKNVVNSVSYGGFPIRSLKLIHFDAKQRASDNPLSNTEPWDVSYVFAYSPSVRIAGYGASPPDPIPPGEEVAPRPPGLEEVADWTGLTHKYGWDYYDVLYVSEEHTAAGGVKFTLPQAKRASIHRIYEQINFATVLLI